MTDRFWSLYLSNSLSLQPAPVLIWFVFVLVCRSPSTPHEFSSLPFVSSQNDLSVELSLPLWTFLVSLYLLSECLYRRVARDDGRPRHGSTICPAPGAAPPRALINESELRLQAPPWRWESPCMCSVSAPSPRFLWYISLSYYDLYIYIYSFYISIQGDSKIWANHPVFNPYIWMNIIPYIEPWHLFSDSVFIYHNIYIYDQKRRTIRRDQSPHRTQRRVLNVCTVCMSQSWILGLCAWPLQSVLALYIYNNNKSKIANRNQAIIIFKLRQNQTTSLSDQNCAVNPIYLNELRPIESRNERGLQTPRYTHTDRPANQKTTIIKNYYQPSSQKQNATGSRPRWCQTKSKGFKVTAERDPGLPPLLLSIYLSFSISLFLSLLSIYLSPPALVVERALSALLLFLSIFVCQNEQKRFRYNNELT